MNNINNVFDVNKELIYFKRLNFDCVDWDKSVGIKFEILYLNKEYFIKILLYDRTNQSVDIEIDGKHNTIRTASLRNLKLRNYIKVGQDGNHKLNKDNFIKVCMNRNPNLENIKIMDDKYFAYWKCGHSKESKRGLLLQGVGCPYCSGHKVMIGYNDINTTKSFIKEFLLNKNDGEKYSKNSTHKLALKCPNCSFEFYKKITNIDNFVKCPNCELNNSSFPENIMFNILLQSKIKFEKEVSFYWSQNKRYDFYIPSLSLIIETHGLQHYKESSFKMSLLEQQNNDNLKEFLAINNGVENYIQIDCRFSEIDWIKKSIYNSKLSKFIQLDKINWNECLEFASKNKIKELCLLWDNSMTTYDFSKIHNIDRSTFDRYLKIGESFGWCVVDRDKIKKIRYEKSSINSRKKVLVEYNSKKYIFKSLRELEEKSIDVFGFKIYRSSASLMCRGLIRQKHNCILSYLK